MKGKLILIVILLAIIFGGYYVAQNFTKNKIGNVKNPISQETKTVASPTATPTQIPLDNASAQDALTQTDTDIQSTLSQLDADLATINQINATLDNSTGL